MHSDVGGDGGDQYLFDYEELKKVMKEATGATDQRHINHIIERKYASSSGAPPYK